jgi:hypothetical protein
MRITPEELAARYQAMSDEELLGLDRAELTDTARQCYDKERERRKIESRPEESQPEADDSSWQAEARPTGGRWICAGMFRTPDEGEAIRELLDSAGIAARLEEGDLLWLGSHSYTCTRVMVPQVVENDAMGLIETQAAQEELAARDAADAQPFPILAHCHDGVFVPVEPVDLEEGTEVEVRLLPTHGARRS